MKRIAHVLIATATVTTIACSGNGKTGNGDTARGTEMADSSGGGDTADRNSTGTGSTQTSGTATLTGCVLAGGDAGNYVLQVASTEATGSTSNAASSSSSSAGNWAPGQTLRLIAANGEDMGQHLNHKVVVNGQVENTSSGSAVGTSGMRSGAAERTPNPTGSGASTTRSGGADASSRSGMGASTDMQAIRAESIRKVADKCQ